jgi:type VI secretion system secreted protein Hcp
MTHRIVPGWIAAAVLGLASTLATAETYLLVPGVTGDSVAKGNEGWIRVAALTWEVEAESSWTKGGGASVGKPNPGKISLKLASGPWSTAFLRAITTGTTLDKPGGLIFLDHRAADGRLLVRLKMDGLYVTQYMIASASQELPQDQLKGVFKTVRLEYYYGASDPKVAPTALDWDIPALKVN